MPGNSTVFDPKLNELAGTHRVQRVSVTEKRGRRHSSFVTVVTFDSNDRTKSGSYVDPKHVRIDTFRDTGPGGQHRNKTDSGVRLTHLPTGTVVTATEDRSQHQNRRSAWERLQRALQTAQQVERARSANAARRSEVLSAQRDWSWCSWRDEVKSPNGNKASMDRVLSGRLGLIL